MDFLEFTVKMDFEIQKRINEKIKAWRYGEQIIFMIPNYEIYNILGSNPEDIHLFSTNKSKGCLTIQKYIQRGDPRDCYIIYDSGTIEFIDKDKVKTHKK